MRKKYFTFILVCLLSIIMVGCTSNNEVANENESNDIDENQENKPTLSIGKTPWTSTVPPTEIAKIILEDMGYKVKEKHAECTAPLKLDQKSNFKGDFYGKI